MQILNGDSFHGGGFCPFEIFSFVQKVKKKGYKIPPKIIFSPTVHWGLGWVDGSKIQISSHLDLDFAKIIFLHELIHSLGNKKHNEDFWRDFILACERMNISPEPYFRHPDAYASGKKFWVKYKKGEVKCQNPKRVLSLSKKPSRSC